MNEKTKAYLAALSFSAIIGFSFYLLRLLWAMPVLLQTWDIVIQSLLWYWSSFIKQNLSM